jgi:hypothetical protein
VNSTSRDYNNEWWRQRLGLLSPVIIFSSSLSFSDHPLLSPPSLPPLRLQKQKKELEERKYLERVEMESKLSDIASQRHRTKDIFLIPPPAVGAGGDVDDKSKSSNGSTKKDKVSALPKIKRLKGSESTSDTLQVRLVQVQRI